MPPPNKAKDPPTGAAADQISSELQRLTVASIGAFNDKDFSYTQTPDRAEFLTRISPNFQASVERVKGPLDWEGLSNLRQHLAATMPETRFEIVNVTVDFLGYNRASVFLETSTVVQEGVRWNRIMEYKWYEVEGVWMHSGIVSISGSQGNSGMVE